MNGIEKNLFYEKVEQIIKKSEENKDESSMFNKLKKMSKAKKEKFIKSLSQDEAHQILFDPLFMCRPKQLKVFSEQARKSFVTILDSGRGFGKTFVASHWVKQKAKETPNGYVNIVGLNYGEIERVFINGPSGIMAICSEFDKPTYFASKNLLIWPNGCKSLLISAEEPDNIRGKSADFICIDEFCAMHYMQQVFDQIVMTARENENVQILIATTPKFTKFYKDLKKRKDTFSISGTTFENTNLSKKFLEYVTDMFDGTRIGRQELYAELLDNNEEALFNINLINETRVSELPCKLTNIVVSVDPAVTSKSTSDLTGIVVVGKGEDGFYYVLRDETMLAKPNDWVKKCIDLYYEYNADYIVAEANNGGDFIETLIKNFDDNVNYKKVHASKGKITRAEPVAALYEKKFVRHVGNFDKLEEQMSEFTGALIEAKSPDRVDALVWGITELSGNFFGILDLYRQQSFETKEAIKNMNEGKDFTIKKVEFESSGNSLIDIYKKNRQ